jgi:DNA-directed RNA polymerase subunit omega
MARTTVEDCLQMVPNQFDLAMIAARRARKMAMSGDTGRVEQENDKPVVIALREVRAGLHIDPLPEPEPESGDEEEEQARTAEAGAEQDEKLVEEEKSRTD